MHRKRWPGSSARSREKPSHGSRRRTRAYSFPSIGKSEVKYIKVYEVLMMCIDLCIYCAILIY